jgi:hypothetical protein
MKIRFALALAGLAISLALPTFAQQANTVDPQLRQVLTQSIKNLTRHLTPAMRLPLPRCTRKMRFL